jgi:hypothetical protein
VESVESVEEVKISLDVKPRAHVNVKAVLGYLHRIRMRKSSLLQEVLRFRHRRCSITSLKALVSLK